MLAALDVGTRRRRGPASSVATPSSISDDLERRAVVVIPADNLGADADRVLRQAHALGDVLLEHEPEAAPLLEPIDL